MPRVLVVDRKLMMCNEIKSGSPMVRLLAGNGARLAILVVLTIMTNVCAAQEAPIAPLDPLRAAEQMEAHRQAIAKETASITRIRDELRDLSVSIPEALDKLQVGEVSQSMVEQARVDAEGARLRVEDLQSDTTNTQRRIKDLNDSIRSLEASEQLLKNPAKDQKSGVDRDLQLARVSRALEQQRSELELEKKHLENLGVLNELAKQQIALYEKQIARLGEIYNQQQRESRRTAEEELVAQLQRDQQAYLDEFAKLRQRLEREGDTMSEAAIRLLETRIKFSEIRAKLSQADIRLARAANELTNLEELVGQADVQPKTLESALEQLSQLRAELMPTKELFDRGMALSEQQKQLIEQREGLSGADARASAEEATIVGDFMTDLIERRTRIEELLNRVEVTRARLEQRYTASLRRDLLERHRLPSTEVEWRELLQGIAAAPQVIYHQAKLSISSAVETMLTAPVLRWLGFWSAEFALLWLVAVGRRAVARYLEAVKDRPESPTFLKRASLVLSRLLRRDLLAFGVSAALITGLWILQVPQPGLGIIATLVLVWVLVRTPISLAWLLLAAPFLPPENRRLPLFRHLAWTITVGGLLAAVTVLSHLSSLPLPVRATFDQVFMCFLLVAFWPALRLRRFLLDLLAARYAGSFWFISLQVSTLILPVALLVAALLGIAGYINLAWAVAWHLAIFVLVLIGWLLTRGILNDLVVFLKNYAVVHSGYGLLWTQEVIRPAHRILDVALFFAAWVVMFRIFGLSGESAIVDTAWNVLDKTLFTLGGADISIWRILLTVVTFVVVIWLGQWIRAVTYRWVYSRIVDLGARHSLSVFTQYAIVVIGILVVLRIIGLDLTTLTVFAGALGVGIGFGLQTIANNFISGLLLLIERPLRSGDTVKIGTNEGEVSRIGMRSLTMTTWDNMAVIIPNSDVITNAFTNWTHTDNVVRTVLMIRVSYTAEPHHVKSVLERVLNANKTVVRDPAPMVLLWEFGESELLFRVQYYMDVVKDNILQCRSDVNFGIWDAFARENIAIPYPQRDLFVKEWPEIPVAQRHKEPESSSVLLGPTGMGASPVPNKAS